MRILIDNIIYSNMFSCTTDAVRQMDLVDYISSREREREGNELSVERHLASHIVTLSQVNDT